MIKLLLHHCRRKQDRSVSFETIDWPICLAVVLRRMRGYLWLNLCLTKHLQNIFSTVSHTPRQYFGLYGFYFELHHMFQIFKPSFFFSCKRSHLILHLEYFCFLASDVSYHVFTFFRCHLLWLLAWFIYIDTVG